MGHTLLPILLGTFVGTRSLVVPTATPTRPRSTEASAQPLSYTVDFTLHQAAAAGDTETVDLLLLTGLSGNDRNAKASTPLHLAARNGHDAVVRTLLDSGAATDVANDDGFTPLHAAVVGKQLEVAKRLLARGAEAEAVASAGRSPMRIAARQGDSAMISALLEAGAELDEEGAQLAFWAAVAEVDKTLKSKGEALSFEAPALLHHVFDADMRHHLRRPKIAQNVTCMQPAEEGAEGVAESFKYIFDYGEHANLPLREGRRCEGGQCCDACSRVVFPTFALPAETDIAAFPQLEEFNFAETRFYDSGTILNFMRLVERIRRAIAHEYGLPLSTILPLQAYSREYTVTKEQAGVPLHTDEATHASYHYSCVLYLSTQGEDFEGGSFVWNDPEPEAEGEDAAAPEQKSSGDGDGFIEVGNDGRVLTPYGPSRGSAVIFSSGWENMHEVHQLKSGHRRAVPCFFTTCPVPDGTIDAMGGVPADDAAIADELLRLILDSQTRSPFQRSEEVKEMMMKWHLLLAPGYD